MFAGVSTSWSIKVCTRGY